MKITRVEAIPLTVPYKMPIGHAFAIRTSGDYVVLKIGTDEGITGIGSGAVLYPRHSGESLDATVSLLVDYLAPNALIGQDPFRIEWILSRIDTLLYGHAIVKAHVDFALHDLIGKALNQPIYNLLGGLFRDRVQLEYIVALDTPEKSAAMAVRFLDAGFKSVKIKGSGKEEEDVARMRAVRQAVGDNVRIGIDFNESYANASLALRTIDRMCELGLAFAEQPVQRGDVAGLRMIREKIRIPLYLDDGAWSVPEAMNAILNNATDGLHTVPSRIGGFHKAKQYAAIAEATGVDMICSAYNGTGLEHAASAHFIFSTKKNVDLPDEPVGILNVHGGTDTLSVTDDIGGTINGRIENGYLYPPQGPGLGVELNQQVVERCLAKGRSPRVCEG